MTPGEMRMSAASNEQATEAALRVVPQQARGKDKIARLLTAADRIMAAEGADAITTIRVAAEAGVSVGSLYRYLPNREAIIESLARHYLGQLEQLMDALGEVVRREPVEDLVGMSVDAFADFYRSHPGFRALWFSRHLTEETRALDRAHKAAMAQRIREVLVLQGFLRADDDAAAAISQTVQLTTDVMIQEAFRVDPDGDHALLEQTKIMVRGYVASFAR